MNPSKITVSGGSLFQLAAQYLNDATLWYQIAQLNGLPPDPIISGLVTLTLPAPDPTGGNGGLFYQ